jgi:hypothetical protein
MFAISFLLLGIIWIVFLPKAWISLVAQIRSEHTSYWLLFISRKITLHESPIEFTLVNTAFVALLILHTFIGGFLIYIGISNIYQT